MLRTNSIHSRRSGHDGLFGWTIFIILLAAFAAISWIGSFYIFGHPEKAFSYRVLRAFGKIDAPKQFALTAAPRGQFLDAGKLFERYAKMPAHELSAENSRLLRAYLRNYEQYKEPVPYVIGSYEIIGTFRLGPTNLFTSGVVALAQSVENPKVLLELVFPAGEKNTTEIERTLVTGLDLKLPKTLDLIAMVNARIMPDGRLNITAVPLLYGTYTSSGSAGMFNLEPPADLNVSAGLPVLNQAAVGEAEKHYSAYLQRAGITGRSSASLMRVQAPAAVKPVTVPVVRAVPVKREQPAPTEQPSSSAPVARAVPVTKATGSEPPVRRAEAVVRPAATAAATPDAVPVRRAEPVQPRAAQAATPAPVVPLQPFNPGQSPPKANP